MTNNLTVGIIGGMGSLATVSLFQKIVECTPVNSESDHLRILIDNNPQIPSRSRALLFNEVSPVPAIVHSGNILTQSGANFLVLPCNTAHCFFDEIASGVDRPLLNMVELTIDYLLAIYPNVKHIGVIGTESTCVSVNPLNVPPYLRIISDYGWCAVTPNNDELINIRMFIDAVKTGTVQMQHKTDVRRVCDSLIHRGAQVIILACTELPIVFSDKKFPVPIIDPTLELAKGVVQFATNNKASKEMRTLTR